MKTGLARVIRDSVRLGRVDDERAAPAVFLTRRAKQFVNKPASRLRDTFTREQIATGDAPKAKGVNGGMRPQEINVVAAQFLTQRTQQGQADHVQVSTRASVRR